MAEITVNSKNFVGYEYKEVSASRDLEGVYADGYPNFGWQLDGGSYGRLKFKRDRKIRNKVELTRLQRNFESVVNEIGMLEKSKSSGAQIAALTVGIIGTAFMASSTFAITMLNPINIPLCIILAIPGLIGWALPYMLFRKVSANKTVQIAPKFDQKYDEIYSICEKSNGLLN
jgi:hypothetical protein